MKEDRILKKLFHGGDFGPADVALTRAGEPRTTAWVRFRAER
jgi:hypothetical protein